VSAVERYRRDILGEARRYKRYPRIAIDNAWEGEVRVRMAIGADGRIAGLSVARGSAHAVLDRDALRLFETAQSRVPVPRELRGQAFEIDVGVRYDLKDQRSGWNTTRWSTSSRMPIFSPSAWLWWLGTSASTRRPLVSFNV
jgi:TonB family protein